MMIMGVMVTNIGKVSEYRFPKGSKEYLEVLRDVLKPR